MQQLIFCLRESRTFTKTILQNHTHNNQLANVPAAEFRVRCILHVEDPAGDEDAQPCQEEVLDLNGWETTLGWGWG